MTQKRNAKGEGSFIFNLDGTVTHRKSVGYKSNGQRKVLTVTAATKASCLKLMRKKEAEWQKYKSASDVLLKDTVAELCYKHLNYQVENDELKNKSIDRRESTIKNQIEAYPIGKIQVRTIVPTDIEQHIQGLIKEKRLAETSITKALDVLNAAFSWAMARGELQVNPVEPIKAKLAKKLRKISEKSAEEADVEVLSIDEIKIFEEEALKVDVRGNRVYPAGDSLLLLLYTGMRCGEMISLKWSDVDWDNGIITIQRSSSMAKNRDPKKKESDNNFVMIEGTTKNQKARMIQLSQEALQTLHRIWESSKWREPDDLITPTQTGRINTASNLEHRMKVILKNAGLDSVRGGLHTLRRTFATQRYEEGNRIEEIAAYLGNLPSTTRDYYVSVRHKIKTQNGVKQIVKLQDGNKE